MPIPGQVMGLAFVRAEPHIAFLSVTPLVASPALQNYETSYRVEGSGYAYSPWLSTGSDDAEFSIQVQGGNRYDIRVRGVNSDGPGLSSDVLTNVEVPTMTEALAGRNCEIRIGGIGTAAATLDANTSWGTRSKTVTRARSEIDATTDDDDGWRSLLVTPGRKSVDVSFSGLMIKEQYSNLLMRFHTEPNTHYKVEIIHPDPGTGNDQKKEVGNFMLSSLETGFEHEDSVTFSATLLSSGAVTLVNA